MKCAWFQATLVDVPEFIAKAGPDFRRKHTYAVCPECGADVYPVRPEGPRKPSFSHFPGHAEECRAESGDVTLDFLGTGSVDAARGVRMRAQFIASHLSNAYSLLRNVCFNRDASMAVFVKMVRRADSRGIWRLAKLELWMVPFILPLLRHFQATDFEFHFTMRRQVLDEETGLIRDGLFLDRVFSDSGTSMQSLMGVPNPLPVTRGSLERHGDVGWIGDPRRMDERFRSLLTRPPQRRGVQSSGSSGQ